MNNAGYLDWPFRPERRSDEQQRQWWRLCYGDAAADRELRGIYHWVLLAGPPGSGKSVALTAWAARDAADTLVLPYPPERWPGARTAWHPHDDSHLTQMLAVAGQEIAEVLRQRPDRAAGVDVFQREFLRALLERQGGPRRYQRFVLSLPLELRQGFQNVPTETDFFGESDTLIGIQALIQELTLLVNALGYQRLVYVVDPDPPLGLAQAEGLGNLFGWLDLTHSPDFVVAAAVRDSLLRDSATLARARSRVGLVYTDWTAAECQAVAERHLCQALPDAPPGLSLSTFLTDDCRALANEMLLAEHGRPNPAAWVQLAEAMLFAVYRTDVPLSPPLTAEAFTTLRRLYFARHVTLRLDPQARGVWRGPRLLHVDDQPLRFLQLLHRRRQVLNWDDGELRDLAGSKNNMHSIASRARRAIEPDPDDGDPIYLRNRKGQEGGYWLENCP